MVSDAFAMRRSPSQSRSRATVVRILDAAAATIEERGYDETTTTAVAARAGVSVGSLYQYFPSKAALLVALADVHVGEATQRWHDLIAGWTCEDSPERVMRRAVEAAVELHGPDTRLHREMFHRTVRTDALDTRLRALHEIVDRNARNMLVDVGVAPEAVGLGARSLVTTVSVVLHDVVLADDLDATHDERIAVVVDACLGLVEGSIRTRRC